MVTDCDKSAGVRHANSEASLPGARGLGNDIIEIEEGLLHVFSSLLDIAQEHHFSTVCRSFSCLKQDAEECLDSGCSPIFCQTFPAKARQALSAFQFLLELKERTNRLPAAELRAKSAELERYLAYAEWEYKDSEVRFKSEAARLAGIYAMRVSRFVEETSEQLSDEIHEQFRMLEEADRSKRSSRMNSFVQARLQNMLGNWQSPLEESSRELFQHAAMRFGRHACELIAGVRSSTRSLFGFSASSAEWCVEFGESDCLECTRERNPDCSFSDVRLYFPSVQFRKHLLRNTLRNTSSDLLGYASRTVEEHRGRLDKCCAGLLRRMGEQLNETKESICDVVETSLRRLERPDKSVVSAAHECEETRKAFDALSQCADTLERLLCRWESIDDTPIEDCANAKGRNMQKKAAPLS